MSNFNDLIAVNDDQHLVYTEEERKQAFYCLWQILQKPKEYSILGEVFHEILTNLYEEAECSEENKSSKHLWYVAIDKMEEYLEGFPREYRDKIVKGLYQFMREYIGLKIVD